MKKSIGICLLVLMLTFCCSAGASWVCSNCGVTENNGNFCPQCGTPSTGATWNCASCGSGGNASTALYCVDCGSARNANQQVSSGVRVGDVICFGRYPQTKSGLDNTPIEWKVIAVKGNSALVISRYVLDCQPFYSAKRSITWESSSIRPWLNNDFYNRAFSAQDKAFILTTRVDNSDYQGHSGRYENTHGGNDTVDNIFLLSYREAWKYFGLENDYARMCPATAYAKNRGAEFSTQTYLVDGQGAALWWLRSPGGRQNAMIYVDKDGSHEWKDVNYKGIGVRPACWIDLNKFSQ